MEVVLTIFTTLLLITVLVFFHELGHFLAAKIFNISVNEFSIGFGRKIFSKTFRGTEYSIRLLPLGGFVDLEGETDSTEEKENSFRNKPAYQKIIVLSAGVFMNIILAIVAFMIFLPINDYTFTLPSLSEYRFSNTQSQSRLYPLFVTSVDEDGNSAGQLSVGDIIVSLNGIEFSTYLEFQELLKINQESTVSVGFFNLDTFHIKHRDIRIGAADEEGSILNVRLFEMNRSGTGSLAYPAYFLSYPETPLSGVNLALDLVLYVPKSLGSIISKSFETGNFTELGNSVGGPLQIVDNSNQIIQAGATQAFIPLAGLLSISLAIFNILPFPALDGGQIVVVLIERITRRKIPDELLGRINLFGFIFLISLAILLTFKDFIQLNVINKFIELFN